jgi:hypothetical protein
MGWADLVEKLLANNSVATLQGLCISSSSIGDLHGTPYRNRLFF